VLGLHWWLDFFFFGGVFGLMSRPGYWVIGLKSLQPVNYGRYTSLYTNLRFDFFFVLLGVDELVV